MSDRAILMLVRHGQTSANRDAVWHGSTDTPLTDQGRAQAERVAAHLSEHCADASAIYSSPLQRARHTAEAIGRSIGLEIREEPDITEYHMGSWEEKTYKELFEVHKLWQNIVDDHDFAPHGGESPRQVVDRFVAALRRIEEAHVGERVIVVSHGGAMAMVLGELIRGNCGQWFEPMQNCAFSELVLRPAPELLRFNVAEHLAPI